jgi:hypothetical protein
MPPIIPDNIVEGFVGAAFHASMQVVDSFPFIAMHNPAE